MTTCILALGRSPKGSHGSGHAGVLYMFTVGRGLGRQRI